jgi:DNA primase
MQPAPTVDVQRPPSSTHTDRERVDVDEVKAHHPIVDVVARYVPLRRTGRTFVGPCPFHHDTGRPNLVIFPATSSWYCFRCNEGGDTITFVEKRERVGFLDAVARLTGNLLPAPKWSLPCRDAWRSLTTPLPEPDADSLRIVQGAAMAYYATLLGDPEAKRYLASRKISLDTAHKHLVGVCRGSRLVPYLKGHKLSLRTAADLGLLSPDGREFFTGRLTIAEIAPGGKTLHLTGRAFVQPDREPKYLSAPGLAKPLYGWARAKNLSRTPILTESITDFLTLSEWGYVPLCTLGTGMKEGHIELLKTLRHVAAVPHNDEAGWEAVARWREALPDLLIIPLPDCYKDLNAWAQARHDAQPAFDKLLPRVRRR